jgi:hypothetical protein
LQAIGAQKAAEMAEAIEQGGSNMLPALEGELHEVLRAATEACRRSEPV